MIELQSPVNTVVSVPFVANGNATGQTGFSYTLLFGSTVSALPVTFTEVGSGFYIASFTPDSTGDYSLFTETNLVGHIKVTTKDLATYLENIENATLGSWQWDKQTGVITMYTETGTVLATFNMTSTPSQVSRERV